MSDRTHARSQLLFRSWTICSIGCGFGLWLACFFRFLPSAKPIPMVLNIFAVFFARNEPVALVLTAVFLVALLIWARATANPAPGTEVESGKRPDISIPVALWVFAFTIWGTFGIYHNYLLSMDEFLADFQAKIFLAGRLTGEIPPEWRSWSAAMTPPLLGAPDPSGKWVSFYLPVWASMRAVFLGLGVPWMLSPLLAAGSIMLIPRILTNAGLAKEVDSRAAVLLLGTSAQFLITAMSAYAMTAHIFLNCLWLWFYTKPGRGWIWACPVVSLFAIGLHQPNVHGLFLLPFLWRILRQKRWLLLAAFGVTLALAAVLCEWWWSEGRAVTQVAEPQNVRAIVAQSQIQTALLHWFLVPDFGRTLVQISGLILLFSWASVGTGFFFVVSVLRSKWWSPLILDLFVGVVITQVFYVFYPHTQGHGWGNRYSHAILASVAIIAAAGVAAWSELYGRQATHCLLSGCVVISLLIFLPLRAYQTETFIRPYAETFAQLQKVSSEVVILDNREIWYGADFMRNDPFLRNRPLFIRYTTLTPAQRTAAKQLDARFFDGAALSQWGLSRLPLPEERITP